MYQYNLSKLLYLVLDICTKMLKFNQMVSNNYII